MIHIKIKQKKLTNCLIGMVLLVVIVCCCWYGYSTKQGKEYPARIEPVEILQKEYNIHTENGIQYVFQTDGTLRVSGTGTTAAFSTLEEGQAFFLKELYTSCTGNVPKNIEQAMAFLPVLDQVKKIEIEEGITELGKGSFGMFFNAREAVLPDSLKKAGDAAFLGAGQYSKGVNFLGKKTKEIEQGIQSFQSFPSFVLATEDSIPKEAKVSLRPKEELGTVPKGEVSYSLSLPDGIVCQLYENGVLVISGTGEMKGFDAPYELEALVMEQFHWVCSQEAKERWFLNVAEIVITEGVTGLGDFALAGYENVEAISTGSSLQQLGKGVFFSCGSRTEDGILWNVKIEEEAKVHQDAFLGCVMEGEKYEK